MAIEATGYKRSTYSEILDEIIADAKKLFGDDIGVSDKTVLGKYMRIIAYRESKLEEEMEKLYYSAFIMTASDSSLDLAAGAAMAQRSPASAAAHLVTVTGDKNVGIPYGTLFRTDNDITFFNTRAEVIGESGTAELIVECTQPGEIGNVETNVITSLVEQSAGLSSVKVLKSQPAVAGAEAESDFIFRRRIMSILQGRGSKTTSSIRAALLKLNRVVGATVIENDTDVQKGDLPPHCVACYVNAGITDKTPEDEKAEISKSIAEVIFEKKGAGIFAYGKEAVELYDEYNEEKSTIGFTYTNARLLWFKITLIVSSASMTDDEKASIEQSIQSNIREFIGELDGKVLVFNKLYGCCYAVDGVSTVKSIKVSSDAKVYEDIDDAAHAFDSYTVGHNETLGYGGASFEWEAV